MMEPKWRRFEHLVYEIQRDLAGGAEVRCDDSVRGEDSGAIRQIDISIRKRIGQYVILIVIDCKDLSEPVDVKDVEGFITMVRDVRANKGAIVSSSGFTGAGIEVAKHYGIDTFRLVDTKDTDWKAYVAIPVLFERLFIHRYHFRLHGFTQVPTAAMNTDIRRVRVFDAQGNLLGTTQDLLAERWNAGEVAQGPGEHEVVLGKGVLLEIDGERWPGEVAAVVGVEREYYFGELPIETRGVRDEQSGGLITREFTTADIEPWRIEQGLVPGWRRIDDPANLAVRPVFRLGYSDVLPTSTETG